MSRDDCTASADLRYTYEIDLNNDNIPDIAEDGTTVNFVFPAGTHRVTFRVFDSCGNSTECSLPVTVNTQVAPIPLCVGIIQATLGTNGTTTLDASSLNIKSTTGCTESEEGIAFSFSPDQVVGTRTFTCADVPNGIVAEQIVSLYVIDLSSGLSSSCDVTVSINDRPNNACANNIASSNVAGLVTDECDIYYHDRR